jgi:hypothetical protein
MSPVAVLSPPGVQDQDTDRDCGKGAINAQIIQMTQDLA